MGTKGGKNMGKRSRHPVKYQYHTCTSLRGTFPFDLLAVSVFNHPASLWIFLLFSFLSHPCLPQVFLVTPYYLILLSIMAFEKPRDTVQAAEAAHAQAVVNAATEKLEEEDDQLELASPSEQVELTEDMCYDQLGYSFSETKKWTIITV